MKLRSVTMGLTVLVAAALILGMGPKARAAEKVRFQMDWIYTGKLVPFFVARDKGYFEKNGLDVKIIKGRGSHWSATSVDTKQADYSYGDFLTATRFMSKGGKNRVIGAGMALQGGAYIFLEGSGIRTPKDLEGKRFGGPPADFSKVLMPAMAVASDFDQNKVIIKTMKPAVRTPALFEGKIDFMGGMRGGSVPRMEIIAKRQGRKAKFLFFKDMGLETYGHMLQTHADRIKSNPDQVRRFVAAVYDAWAWSIKNPEKALDIYMKANPELDRKIHRAQMLHGLSDVQDPKTKKFGLGYMREDLVKSSVAIANKYFKLSPAVDYKMTYTNQFIRKNP
jgi:NitT/TauT family transport system substrate-binding protein